MDEEQLRQRKAAGAANDDDASESRANYVDRPAEHSASPTTAASLPNAPEPAISSPSTAQERDAYFEALRVWLQQVQLQQTVMAMFPYYLANCQQSGGFFGSGSGSTSNTLPQQYQPNPFYFPQYASLSQMSVPQGTANTAAFAAFAQQQQQRQQQNAANFNNQFNQNRNQFIDNIRRNEEIIQQNGGYEYVIAPIWKRFVAETIDVLILFIIKIMAAFLIIDIFDFDFGFDLDFDTLKNTLEEDYTDFLTFSSDLLLVEIITKILVCFYEAVWTSHGQTFIGGATPGKIIMGLRILYVEGVVPLDQFPPGINLNNTIRMRALVYPAANPGFKRALLRAIAKNMLMTLMFPMCFVLLFFRHNRTGYDVMTKTIVVEQNALPLHRRL